MRLTSMSKAAIAAILMVAVATPALAQRTGTRMGRDARSDDLPKAMRIMAECMAGKRGNMLRQWFDTLPGTMEEDKILERELGDMGLCLDDRMLVVDGKTIEVTARMVRYPLALAKARRELRLTSAVPTMNRDHPWFAAKLAGIDKSAPVDRVALGLQDFGHCVAARDWNNARALVMSEEGSSGQKAAIAALKPLLGPCLQSNVQIKLNAANLRNALAEPMVHALQTAPASASATR